MEDLVSSGVPVRTSLGAKQASQLPCAVLSGDKGGGLTAWPLRQIEGDPVTKRPWPYPAPLTYFPSARAFWKRRPGAS